MQYNPKKKREKKREREVGKYRLQREVCFCEVQGIFKKQNEGDVTVEGILLFVSMRYFYGISNECSKV